MAGCVDGDEGTFLSRYMGAPVDGGDTTIARWALDDRDTEGLRGPRHGAHKLR